MRLAEVERDISYNISSYWNIRIEESAEATINTEAFI
jgi:hypothetical protein